MTEARTLAPTIPEIKDMDMASLFTEAARMQHLIAQYEQGLPFALDEKRKRSVNTAIRIHHKALGAIVAEIAARYVTSEEDKRAVLFKLMGSVAISAKAWLQSDPDDPVAEKLYLRLVDSIDLLDSLR